MSELWTIKTPKFTMPFWCDFTDNWAHLKAACYMRGRETEAVKGVITALGGRYELGRWVVPIYAFKTTAHQHSLNTEPETLISWTEGDAPLPTTKGVAFELPPGQSEFVKAFWQAHTPHNSYDDLIVCWHRFTTFAMEWMIVRKKPLDLGFALLVPTPYRANWKSILTQRFPNMGIHLRKGHEAQERAAIETGLGKSLLDPWLFHYSKGLVHWGIDVYLKKLWHKNMLKAERTRFQIQGPAAYADYLLNFCRSHVGKHLRLLAAWFCEIARPCGEFRSGPKHGSFILCPYYAMGKVRPIPARNGDHPPVVPNKLGPPKVEDARGSVSPMPRLQQDTEDVRNGWGIGS